MRNMHFYLYYIRTYIKFGYLRSTYGATHNKVFNYKINATHLSQTAEPESLGLKLDVVNANTSKSDTENTSSFNNSKSPSGSVKNNSLVENVLLKKPFESYIKQKYQDNGQGFFETLQFSKEEQENQYKYTERCDDLLIKIRKNIESTRKITKSECYEVFKILRRDHTHSEFSQYPTVIIDNLIRCGIKPSFVVSIMKHIFMIIYFFTEEESIIKSIITCTFSDADFHAITMDMVRKSKIDDSNIEGRKKNNFKLLKIDKNTDIKIENMIKKIISNGITEIKLNYNLNGMRVMKIKEKICAATSDLKEENANPILLEMITELTEFFLFNAVAINYFESNQLYNQFYKKISIDESHQARNNFRIHPNQREFSHENVCATELKTKEISLNEQISDKMQINHPDNKQKTDSTKIDAKNELSIDENINELTCKKLNPECKHDMNDIKCTRYVQRIKNQDLVNKSELMFDSMIQSTTDRILEMTKKYHELKKENVMTAFENFFHKDSSIKNNLFRFLKNYIYDSNKIDLNEFIIRIQNEIIKYQIEGYAMNNGREVPILIFE